MYPQQAYPQQQQYAPPQQQYSGPPQQQPYYPQQGYPPAQQAPPKKDRGCLMTCLATLCCCFLCTECCESCADCCECCMFVTQHQDATDNQSLSRRLLLIDLDDAVMAPNRSNGVEQSRAWHPTIDIVVVNTTSTQRPTLVHTYRTTSRDLTRINDGLDTDASKSHITTESPRGMNVFDRTVFIVARTSSGTFGPTALVFPESTMPTCVSCAFSRDSTYVQYAIHLLCKSPVHDLVYHPNPSMPKQPSSHGRTRYPSSARSNFSTRIGISSPLNGFFMTQSA